MSNPYNTSIGGGGGGENGIESGRRFSVILSARGNDEGPSDLEYALRSHCKKLMVKSASNLSGAHLVLPIEKIAIRAYYPYDLEQIKPTNSSSTDDFEGLSKFLKSFLRPLVMFILPPNDPVFQQQLDDTNSYFHRAQRLVGEWTMKHPDKTIHVLLFPDTNSAVDGLFSFVESFTPQRIQKKKQYFLEKQERYLVPLPAQNKQQHERLEEIAGRRAAEAFRNLCHRADLPESEDVMLMHRLGTLENIVQADDATLDHFPVEERTKDFLLSFFGSAPIRQQVQTPYQPQKQFVPNYEESASKETLATATDLPPRAPLQAPIPTHNGHSSFQTPIMEHQAMASSQQVYPGWSGSVEASIYKPPQMQGTPFHHLGGALYSSHNQYKQNNYAYAQPSSNAGYSTSRKHNTAFPHQNYPLSNTAPRPSVFSPLPHLQLTPYSAQTGQGLLYAPSSGQAGGAGNRSRGITRFQKHALQSANCRPPTQPNHFWGYEGY